MTTGIDKWTLTVKDHGGAVKRTFSGTATRAGLAARSTARTTSGRRFRRGSYVGSLNVVYSNGHTPTADSPLVHAARDAAFRQR